ncbi:hypothetical protein ABG067_006190 [Albugo candida]|uniref:Uncharacterized protein n=1 Tax=Albugo candida TaxID=65357 RepID=A0A024G7B7_9STRA|nr:unnamed protein product [Albugo candida]|eukprot:CCI42409.1 unnamed protein product [Albugo candida]
MSTRAHVRRTQCRSYKFFQRLDVFVSSTQTRFIGKRGTIKLQELLNTHFVARGMHFSTRRAIFSSQVECTLQSVLESISLLILMSNELATCDFLFRYSLTLSIASCNVLFTLLIRNKLTCLKLYISAEKCITLQLLLMTQPMKLNTTRNRIKLQNR